MRYFSQSDRYVHAECESCGRVLKVPRERCAAASGGFSVTPAAVCRCGAVSAFIAGLPSDGDRRKNDHHMPELMEMLERLLPLDRWKFRLSARYVSYAGELHSLSSAGNYSGLGYPYALYDSETCRLRVEYLWNPRAAERSIRVRYGRPGIPDDAKGLLAFAGPESYPLGWHNVYPALYFLDGLSPGEARAAGRPRLVEELEGSAAAGQVTDEPEKDLLLHAAAWERYGQRLFGIFDPRRGDLWAQYAGFLGEHWKGLRQG